MKTRLILVTFFLVVVISVCQAKKEQELTEEQKQMIKTIQTDYPLSDDGTLKISRVVFFDNAKREDIYSSSMSWAVKQFPTLGNFEATIKGEVETGEINISYVFNLENRTNMDLVYSTKGSVGFSMNIKVKDGKAKMTIIPTTREKGFMNFTKVKEITSLYPLNSEAEQNADELECVYKVITDSEKLIDIYDMSVKTALSESEW